MRSKRYTWGALWFSTGVASQRCVVAWLGCGYCWPRGLVPSCRGQVAGQLQSCLWAPNFHLRRMLLNNNNINNNNNNNNHNHNHNYIKILESDWSSAALICNGNRTEWSPIRSVIICLSRVRLQTELDDTKSYYQLIIKITISEKRKIAKLCDKGKFYLEESDKGCINLGACTLFLQ